MPWINLPVPTVRVKHKDGTEMIINAADFDESIHTLVEETKPEPATEADTPGDIPAEEEKLKVKRRVKKPASN